MCIMKLITEAAEPYNTWGDEMGQVPQELSYGAMVLFLLRVLAMGHDDKRQLIGQKAVALPAVRKIRKRKVHSYSFSVIHSLSLSLPPPPTPLIFT